MQIHILIFGHLVDIFKTSQLTLENIPDTDSLSMLLHQKYPVLQTLQYRISLNESFVRQNTLLKDRDTLALLPPFSGG